MAAYVTLAEARTAGIPGPTGAGAISDVDANAAMLRWSEFIDAATKQWFDSRAVTLLMDGNDSRTLFLPVPIITLSALYVNSDFTTALATNLYAVYNRADSARDDRRNPMIKFSGSGLGIYDSPDFRMGSMFVRGEQNQKLVGNFGFVESDGSTPQLIKRAVLKLAIRELQSGGGNMWAELAAGGPLAGGGTVASESTDGHTISYAAFSMRATAPGLNGITKDPEVDRIIDLYKGPLKITSTVGNGGPDRRF